MKCSGIRITKSDNGQNLLTVVFEDGDEGKCWMPKWDDLCHGLRSAIITEVVNSKGDWNKEMGEFWETAEFLRRVCYIIAAMNKVDLK